MDWTWGWTAIGAIATSVLALGIVFAFLQVRAQLRAARISANAQIAVELFRELRGSQTIEKFRLIYGLKADDFRYLPTCKRNDMDYVLDRFELVGALAASGVVDKKLAIEPYGGPAALRCWYILCTDYIKVTRDKRGYFCENYEGFARFCLDYFHEAGIQVKLYREGEEDKELVFQELQKDELRPRSFKKIERDRKKSKPKG